MSLRLISFQNHVTPFKSLTPLRISGLTVYFLAAPDAVNLVKKVFKGIFKKKDKKKDETPAAEGSAKPAEQATKTEAKPTETSAAAAAAPAAAVAAPAAAADAAVKPAEPAAAEAPRAEEVKPATEGGFSDLELRIGTGANVKFSYFRSSCCSSRWCDRTGRRSCSCPSCYDHKRDTICFCCHAGCSTCGRY